MKPQRIYIAARYSRRDEMRRYVAAIHAAAANSFVVVADWITGDHDATSSELAAEIDFREVIDADIVMSFTEPPGEVKGRGRGGRHVEFGIGLALGARSIVVGHRENVFHHLPNVVEFYPTFEDALLGLVTP